jgi:ribonuclease Y
MESLYLVYALAGLVAGATAGFIYRQKFVEKRNRECNEIAEKIIKDAENSSKEKLLKAKSEALKVMEEAKKEEQIKREEILRIEKRLLQKEESLHSKAKDVEKKKMDLEQKMQEIKEKKEEVDQLHASKKQELEKVAQLSEEEAKDILFKKIEIDYEQEFIEHIRKFEKNLYEKAQEKAKNILAEAIQKYASETASESTATIVNLPSDDLKGRIIGREGRNITTFEQITGIDVIVDDTPGSIIISGFDLVRRYIAKTALERLISDGRIHPARIEETVLKVKEEVSNMIKELGEKAAYETGVAGLHPNLLKLLGRLKFRTSNGQNVLKHSIEVSFLAGHLASEIGANENLCRRAGLLHDIGKAVDHEVPGHHAKVGADIAKKFGLTNDVVEIIENHHGSPNPISVETMVVSAANIISNSRPGAAKDNLETYIRRLSELENIANSFAGVEKSYAVHAGQEVRIFVKPEEVTDLQAIKLSHEIASKIEKDLNYPNPIKVHIIRELRIEEFAQ